MRYENLLASRYIKAQKRQSAFTVISIIAAVAIITMVFLLYSVFMDCLRNTEYSKAPYHLMISGLTEEQGEALADEEAVRSVKLLPASDGKVSAVILFDRDIGDSFQWLSDTAAKHGFENIIPDNKYAWNEKLMNIDTIGYDAHLYKLRLRCMCRCLPLILFLPLKSPANILSRFLLAAPSAPIGSQFSISDRSMSASRTMYFPR